MNKITEYILSKADLFICLGLGLLFYVIFFHNIWAYPLMDADETRYVSMARDMFYSKDFLTLYLNGEYFFEKPPLYFWNECLSFAIFGHVNEFTARFPVALCGTTICFLIYFMGKKVVSRSYGVISALILATSLEYVMLSKLAILDIVLSANIAFSLCFGLIVHYCREGRQKYYWWLFYIFSGLAVMSKGLPGIIVPFGSIFFISIIAGKLKDMFKPINIVPGVLLFLLITLPWHVIMFKLHNPFFWNEYIVKHHLARFMGSKEINRSEPFYFYFLTLLWGFFPWVVSCLTVWISKIKNFMLFFHTQDKVSQFLFYNFVIVVFTLLFFTTSETKLITYILPLFPALSYLGGYIWYRYLTKKENEFLINITNYIIGGLLLLVSIGGILTPLYLSDQLLSDIAVTKMFCILTSFASGVALILFTKKKLYYGSFVTLVIFMSLFSAIATKQFYEIDYKFGQNDLMEFADYAETKDVSLTTFNFGTKYSLIYYGDMPVTYGPQAGIDNLNNALKMHKNMVIIKTKDLKDTNIKNFDIIKTGKKYSLLEEKGIMN